ncbi:MAG: gamma-glutamyltransferase family protein [Pseudomonadota bacterium]
MNRHRPIAGIVVLLLTLLAACTRTDAPVPEAAEDSAAAPAVAPEAEQGSASPASAAIVVTANPHATKAGEAVLRAGGSAVDAAIAIEATLSLVEPQSSGFGGGAFMTYYDAEAQRITVYDGREVAPAGATPDLFLDENGEVYGYLEAKNSGKSIGVPGVVAMLSLAHDDHGTLPWEGLFDYAIDLASNGFDVSPRLKSFFEKYGTRLIPATVEEGPLDAYNYFFDDAGEIRDRIVNTAYADTLQAIRKDPTYLYHGDMAQAIVDAAHFQPRAGTLSLEDIAAYQPRRLEPLCAEYRGLELCGPPPPSSWVAIGMILGILDQLPFPSENREADWATFIEAQRLSYADRDYFVADDTAIDVPIEGMLNPAYLAERAAMIDPEAALPVVEHGDPWAFEEREAVALLGEDTTIDYAGTSHFVVTDAAGNVVSMTATVESIFGSARMAGGMFLNNQLTDFAKNPRDAEGRLVANHPAPGKRPRSSMTPTIALDAEGKFVLATGSPGGNSIIAYTSKTLVGMLDWGMSPQEAVNLPNVVARGDTVRIESARATPEFIEAMREHGFEVRESEGENSGLSVVYRHGDGRLEGGVDPRREGTIVVIDPSETANE